MERSAACSFCLLGFSCCLIQPSRPNSSCSLAVTAGTIFGCCPSHWSHGQDISPPSGSTACIQKAWDAAIVSTAAESLLENAPDDLVRARLLASSSKESGAWLHPLPISSLGLRMDDNTIRVAVDLRLGSTLCRPYSCQHCGAKVEHLATHMYSLSCKKSEGRHYRHAAVNDILYRTLASAHIPSRLEPSDLNPSDGKRPDGVTMLPWKNGRPLVWNATCLDTFAPSYRCHATSSAGLGQWLPWLRKGRHLSTLVWCLATLSLL